MQSTICHCCSFYENSPDPLCYSFKEFQRTPTMKKKKNMVAIRNCVRLNGLTSINRNDSTRNCLIWEMYFNIILLMTERRFELYNVEAKIIDSVFSIYFCFLFHDHYQHVRMLFIYLTFQLIL